MGKKYFPIDNSATQSAIAPPNNDQLKFDAWQCYKQRLQAMPYELYLLSEYWRDGGWQVHHVDYLSVRDEIGREQGLVTLCDRCHANRHAIAGI